MNVVRPLAGLLLATLWLVPALAAEVELLHPGDGLKPPIDKTGPADVSSKPSPSRAGGSSSSDYPEEPALQSRHFGQQAALSCAVASKPNAIEVINTSSEDLPPGTRIKWQLKGEGQVGFFALLRPLSGGETLVADNVLQATPSPSAPCVARVL